MKNLSTAQRNILRDTLEEQVHQLIVSGNQAVNNRHFVLALRQGAKAEELQEIISQLRWDD
ncbi:hypothetical protein NB640_12495 [Oxalobacter vibrioformis]|uniref:Uncharacterized protein n=1 Tax=Oxalobacter vibrioformis TaxID=933080 RepID=A0A9E9P2L1_9BURK|nr:hypothetical protein [Oxalobacter vibrioformis]WAW10017.1 hypothetical protein NB640_12495 [Oxalobacter vibrioformis]